MFYTINLKRLKKKMTLWAMLLTFFFALVFIIKSIYPIEHFDLIKKYCRQYNLKPELIYAIIHTESKFKINAISNKGAKGLMQIRKSTADWAAKEINLTDYEYGKIFDPQINIQIGCWYVNNLIKQFGNIDTAICAYNAGSGNVSKWLTNPKFSPDGKKLIHIPFRETRNYLRRVSLNQKIYHFLFRLIIFIEGE